MVRIFFSWLFQSSRQFQTIVLLPLQFRSVHIVITCYLVRYVERCKLALYLQIMNVLRQILVHNFPFVSRLHSVMEAQRPRPTKLLTCAVHRNLKLAPSRLVKLNRYRKLYYLVWCWGSRASALWVYHLDNWFTHDYLNLIWLNESIFVVEKWWFSYLN